MFDIYLLRCRCNKKVADLFEKDVQYGIRRVHPGSDRQAASNEAFLGKIEVTFVMWKYQKLRCAK